MNDKKQEERRIWLIRELQREMPQYQDIRIPVTEKEQWNLLRSLFNVRPPYPASQEFLKVQDEYLSELVRSRGIVDAESLPASELDPRITLWQGDITTLLCDAIVNAANSALLGCWQPCHSCIDNMIHSLSGVQLRIKCNEIIQEQGHEEETGTAKITPAFNLPCKYILHTVGPIVHGRVTEKDFAKKENGAVYLKDDARRNFLSAWQKRKQETLTHPYLKEKLSWGLVPYAQSLLLARYIRGDLDAYPPFMWK